MTPPPVSSVLCICLLLTTCVAQSPALRGLKVEGVELTEAPIFSLDDNSALQEVKCTASSLVLHFASTAAANAASEQLANGGGFVTGSHKWECLANNGKVATIVRRVVSVSTSGQSVMVQTQQAAISELLKSAQVTGTDLHIGDYTADKVFNPKPWSWNYDKSTSKALNSSIPVTATMACSNCFITLTPTIELKLNVSEFHLEELRVTLKGALTAAAELTGSLSVAPVRRTLTFAPLLSPPLCFHIAVVPVCIHFDLPISMPLSFNGGTATVKVGATLGANAVIGAEYVPSIGMQPLHNFSDFKVTAEPPSVTGTAGATVGLAFAPVITLDHIGQVSAAIDPELDLSLSYQAGAVHGSVRAGLKVDVGADVAVEFEGHHIYSHSWGPKQVFSNTWDVYQH